MVHREPTNRSPSWTRKKRPYIICSMEASRTISHSEELSKGSGRQEHLKSYLLWPR